MFSEPVREIMTDQSSITLGFEDGSFGTILYLSNGASNFPKERIEVFTDGKVLQLDNFRKLKGGLVGVVLKDEPMVAEQRTE